MAKLPFLDLETTRRKLLALSSKVSVTAAVTASLPPLPFTQKAMAQDANIAATEFKNSACLVNCGSRCTLKVEVMDGEIVQIHPDIQGNDDEFGKHDIKPCLRGRSSRYRVYNPDRLKYPMKRVGKRGEGRFERITWEEATKTIASELTRIRNTYGSESIYYQYGTGAYYKNQGRPAWRRLLAQAGGYLNYYNSYSTAQISTVAPYTYGGYAGTHFTEIEDSDLVVFFGMNLSETRMSGGGQVEELRRALSSSKAKVVILDPRYTDSAVVEDAEWLPLRPTTDAAVVAGLIHTMIKENLIDEKTINKYAVGFSRETLPEGAKSNASYKDYVLGLGDDGIEKTPQWAAKVSGIPAERLRQLAREIAKAKACYIAQGWGPQRHQNGEQTARAIQILPIIAGQFGRAGTGSGNWPTSGYEVPELSHPNPVKAAIPLFLWTEAIVNPQDFSPTTHGLRNADKLEHGIKFILNQAGNVLGNQHSDLNKTREILSDDTQCEMIVVIDNHMTPTAKFADILLPETTYLESEDLVDCCYASGSNLYMVSMEKTIKPLWEARSTYDVCADIARHLGIEQEFTEGRTQAQWIEKHYNDVRATRPYLPEFAKVKGTGIIDQQRTPKAKSVAYASFYADPIANPLKTPSGKIEIYSAALQAISDEWTLPKGDRITAIPEFLTVAESHLNAEATKRYPLQLTGFHTRGHTHSTYTNVSVVAEAFPDEVWINPIDAKARGIEHGDRVHIFNDRGTVLMQAKVTNRILPGVSAMPQGAWTRNKDGVDVGGCINTLTTHHASPLAKGNPQHTNLVEIKKA